MARPHLKSTVRPWKEWGASERIPCERTHYIQKFGRVNKLFGRAWEMEPTWYPPTLAPHLVLLRELCWRVVRP